MTTDDYSIAEGVYNNTDSFECNCYVKNNDKNNCKCNENKNCTVQVQFR